MTPMRTIGVMANLTKEVAPAMLKRLSAKASIFGWKVLAEPDAAPMIPGSTAVSQSEMIRQMDLLMVFGGDGTMIRAVRQLGDKDTPVLGVNLGSLGFMTSVPIEAFEATMDMVASGNYRISTRSMVECTVHSATRPIATYRALNDVVLGWCATCRMVTLQLNVDGEDVAHYRCDGLIISTPTGSTGHSLSTGGPIVHPETPAFVVSVICPHALSHRPLVVPDNLELMVKVDQARDRMILSVDGQEQQPMVEGDCLYIRKCKREVRFIHPETYSYFGLLRQKLGWKGSSV